MNHLTNTPRIPQIIKSGSRVTRKNIKEIIRAGYKTVGEIELYFKANKIVKGINHG